MILIEFDTLDKCDDLKASLSSQGDNVKVGINTYIGREWIQGAEFGAMRKYFN